jgi:diguanylate cyclase (GGDEF)-like protein
VNPTQLSKLPAVLFEIGKLVGSDIDPGLLLSRISELVCDLIDAQACSVMLLDAKRERLLAKAAYGLRSERIHSLSFAMGEGIAGWVALHGEAVLLDDATKDPRFVRLADSRTPIAAMICVPLIARGERVGVVTATSSVPAAFSASDLEIVRFIATTIALDIENVRLHRVAVTDLLTGAFNREFLANRLPAEVEAASERDRPLSIAMVDVDHFKRVNDLYGHSIGDIVLAEIAMRLRSAIRTGDLLVRYGGEEFLVLLPRATAERAAEIGQRMQERCAEGTIEVARGVNISVTVSVGIAQWRAGSSQESPAELITRADGAMYSAKAKGRNRVELAA